MNTRKIFNFLIKGVIVIQSLLCLSMSALFLSDIYKKNVIDFGVNNQTTLKFSINSLSDDNVSKTYSFLENTAGTLIREIPEVNPNGLNKLNVQVGGHLDQIPELSFLGESIVTAENLHKLVDSDNDNATIGLNISSDDAIALINQPLFSMPIYFSKLSTGMNDTLLGNYVLFGMPKDMHETFLSQLSDVTGIKKSQLLIPSSGYTMDNGIIGLIIVISLVLISLILGILIMSYTLSSTKEIGNLVLLGWGKFDIFKKLFSPSIRLSIYLIPISVVIGLFMYSFKLNSISYTLTSGLVNVILVIFLTGISGIVVWFINPLNAIKGMLPKKVLYSFVLFLYLLSSVGIIGVCYALDAPMQEVVQNQKTLKAWKDVDQYETLKNVSAGSNQTSISGLSDDLDHEMYSWYRNIARNTGVYYISTQHYDETTLFNIKGLTDTPTPEDPFTLITASPNYISDHHIQLDGLKYDEMAAKGIRVYMLPNSWPEEQINIAEKWLTESVRNELKNSSFDNEFKKDKKVTFIKYDPKGMVFTWATQKGEPTFTKDAIISVVTPENMTPFDIGNLRTNVLTGPLKFKNEQVMLENTKNLSEYKLDDNELKFIPVKTFIDGLQKKLAETITLFGALVVFIIVVLILVLIAISFIFSIVNDKIIFVKQMLGFSNNMIYKNVIIFIISMSMIELFLTLLLRSTLGTITIIVVMVLQLVTMYFFIKRHAIRSNQEN